MSDIECPYCGHEYELDHDDGSFYEDGKLEEDQCPECEKFFLVYTSVTYYHEGSKADCLNGAPHNWSNWYQLFIGEKDDHAGQVYRRRICQECEKEEMEWYPKETKR
jgi:NAD-dependent SIR2 family protein deacetylase